MNYKSGFSALIIILLCFFNLQAQVGIGTNTPDNSAQLDISSTSKGFLPPRVALTASNLAGPVSSPATGLLVFNTATASSGTTAVTPGYYYNSGTAASPNWVRLSVVSSLDDLSDAKYEGANFSNSLLIGGESTGTLSSASANTGVGKYVFGALTSGYSNSAFGYNSQRLTSSGLSNTSFGSWALGNNTTGYQNVALGANSLLRNTTARDNVATGTSSMEYNTAGAYNVASGSFSLYNNTTGNDNVGIGVNALYYNQTGTKNVAIGKSALQGTTSERNIGIGYYAGLNNTTGYYNIAIGSESDMGATNLQNAIVIGYGATVSASNSIVMGNTNITNMKTSGTITAGAVTYPKTDGTNGQMLITNGSGTASWSTPGPPAGTVTMFAGSSAPTGYLICDGQAVSRTNYAALFAVIGTSYGAGDGSTTFNVPNLMGRVPVGAGLGTGLTNRVLASQGGEESHTLTSDEIPSHSHSINDPGHSHTSRIGRDDGNNSNNAGQAPPGDATTNILDGYSTTNNTTGITINSTGGGQAHNLMQPFLVLNYIIKF